MAAVQQPAFHDVLASVDPDQLEREILAYWKKEKIFERSLEQTKQGELFTFYDGPPYATGQPHYGHILQSAIKDTVLRFKTMQGRHVPRRVGWDCHGLPVETIVEKDLGFTNKKDIEKFGIEKFNQQCRQTVHRYINEFTATLQRMGRWADYDGAYSTLDIDYMESEWWAFKQLWDLGLVYKAFRSSPYCVRCATPLSNFEVTSNYKNVTDQAVYVLLPVSPTSLRLRGADQKLSLLIWTTTPWTLPANVAVAYNPQLTYVVVESDGNYIIMAQDRVQAVLGSKAKVAQQLAPAQLEQLSYDPLYPLPPQHVGADASAKLFGLVPSDHVSGQDGTGLVHIAPAFGAEDFEIGKRHNLPVVRTVDSDGRYLKDVPQWGNQNVFEANPRIIADLKGRGLLFRQEDYTHSYPFCWRCDTPLIYYALDSWFIRIEQLKPRLLAINEQINWVPEHVKHGRFAKGIEAAPDWAVSRNRFWSVPMPIWQCNQCGQQVCIGSVAELRQLSGQSEIPDIHRPYVDELTWACTECDGRMRRIEEVLDVWFDSGAMPYSQWHYPFEHKEFVEQGFPADFIAESIEMTRAWFYVLHVLATALTTKDIGLGKDKPAFSNVIASGLIFAEDGQKLSKKLKNYPDIEPTLKTYGADVLRMYLLTSTSLGEPYRFSEKDLRQLRANVYLRLWNVYSFFVRYANTRGFRPSDADGQTASKHVLDRWLIARSKQLAGEVMAMTDAYYIDTAARAFVAFIDDLSNWYVRRSRRRFQPSFAKISTYAKTSADKSAGKTDGQPATGFYGSAEAFVTLYMVLVQLSKLLAPFMPFLAEEMYRNLTGEVSVHLQRLTAVPGLSTKEQELLNEMDQARRIVSLALAERATSGIKVRQPLARLTVTSPQELSGEVVAMISEEVNVDEISITTGDELVVKLDTLITPELRARGLARDIIRFGQTLRRQAGYALSDRIVLVARTNDRDLQTVLDGQMDTIVTALQADELATEGDEDAGFDVTIDGKGLHLGVRKAS